MREEILLRLFDIDLQGEYYWTFAEEWIMAMPVPSQSMPMQELLYLAQGNVLDTVIGHKHISVCQFKAEDTTAYLVRRRWPGNRREYQMFVEGEIQKGTIIEWPAHQQS